MAEYPQGPLPDRDDLEARVCEIMSDVGIANLSLKALRKRLEGHYKIDMTPHRVEIQSVVQSALGRKEFQKSLAAIQKQQAEAAPGGKGRRASKKSTGETTAGTKGKAKGRKAKNEKPANYPKAPLGAYFLFANAVRPKVLAENPTMAMKDQGVKIGEMWRNLDEEGRRPYVEEAQRNREKYAKEMEAYLANGGVKFKRDGKRKRAADPDAPKRALSAYFFFLKENRQKILNSAEGLKTTDVARRGGELWASMSAEEKKPFEDMAAKDKARYEKEMKQYKDKGGGRQDLESESSDDSSSDE